MAVRFQKRRANTWIVVLVALLWSLVPVSAAYGVVVDDLYRASVPVEGQDDEALAKGYRAGLEQVLVRVSGEPGVVSRDGVAPYLDNAEPLLTSWQVESSATGDDRLLMTFAPQSVNRILAESGARVWGRNRPLTLAWIAVQDGGDRGLLVETGDAFDQGWSALIRDNARQRGLPLVLPPADRAGDRRLLSEVWGQFMGQVARASSGIEHDLLAVVRVFRRNGGWQASWLFQGRGIEQSLSVSADSPEALASAMVDAWAGALAGRYAVSGGAVQTGPVVRLTVEGVRSAGDYAAIKRALSGLNPVESVGAVEVSRGRITFLVKYSGEMAQLQQNIALDDRFRALGSETPAGASSDKGAGQGAEGTVGTLLYRWQESVIAPSGAESQ